MGAVPDWVEHEVVSSRMLSSPADIAGWVANVVKKFRAATDGDTRP
jgi:hypothetical protein